MYTKIYKPKKLNELNFNEDITYKLYNIGLQNILIYGSKGSGKKTRINCYLENIFGESIYETKLNTYTSNKNITISYKISNYHYEINPSNCGTKDKDIIVELIGNLALSKNILTNKHKVFIINETEKLTKKAQLCLRNIIEKSYNTSKFILICNDLTKIIISLKDRFYLIRNPIPKKENVYEILKLISEKTKIKTSTRAINTIIENSSKLSNILDLSYIINIYQISYITNKYVKYIPNFTFYIDSLINILIDKKLNLNISNQIRELIYNIYVSNVDISMVFKYITIFLLKNINEMNHKIKIINEASKYQAKMCMGNKEPLYLEAFIYKLINIIKKIDNIKIKKIKIKNINYDD
jgi:replication factor C subunit 3/5